MDARIQEMLDHHEIRKTLAEYCHGCDRADEPHMGSVYASDSWDDHGDVKASGDDFARIMTTMRVRKPISWRSLRPRRPTAHHSAISWVAAMSTDWCARMASG